MKDSDLINQIKGDLLELNSTKYADDPVVKMAKDKLIARLAVLKGTTGPSAQARIQKTQLDKYAQSSVDTDDDESSEQHDDDGKKCPKCGKYPCVCKDKKKDKEESDDDDDDDDSEDEEDSDDDEDDDKKSSCKCGKRSSCRCEGLHEGYFGY